MQKKMTLTSFLPAPAQLSPDQLEAEEREGSQRSLQTSLDSSRREPPSDGCSKGWVLQPEDFGDGGPFPINEKFAKLYEALDIAEWKAQGERRAGMKTHVEKEDGEARERDEIRQDRRKERQHDRNLSRAAPDKRSKPQRNENRDISEVIALGVPNARTSNEVQFDQRLFNQSKGMDSGFAGGEDEIYNVYDQAWRGGKDMAQSIYKPSKTLDKDMYGDDLETRIKTNRFVLDKEFSGTDRRQRGREGPVQFEEDPFGLDKLLEETKQHHGSKRCSDSSRSKEHEPEGKKQRKQ